MDRNQIKQTFARRDLLVLLRLMALFIAAWVLPERSWKRIGAIAAWLARRFNTKIYAERIERHRSAFGIDANDPGAKQAVLRASLATNNAIMQCFREYRWDGWNPDIHISGAEHLNKAMASGKSAVLWIQSMPYSDLLAKKALASIGFPPHHLSRSTHGFSASRFGVRVLNRIWTRIEDRYLSERITIHGRSTIAAMRVLRSRLADNRVISITVDDNAVKTVSVPFFSTTLNLPTSPISLSLRHGAPLIPVFTLRAADGGFSVIIGPAIEPRAGVAGADAILGVAQEYASRLERLYTEHPNQRQVVSCISRSRD